MRSLPLTIGGREYLTCREAARLYGCTMGFIRSQARSGRLEAMQIGRTWVIDAAQIRSIAKSDGKKMAKGFVPN